MHAPNLLSMLLTFTGPSVANQFRWKISSQLSQLISPRLQGWLGDLKIVRWYSLIPMHRCHAHASHSQLHCTCGAYVLYNIQYMLMQVNSFFAILWSDM